MAIGSRRLVASILVIGLLSVALSLVCTEGAHLPFGGGLDGKCAVMAHSDITPAIVGTESSQTLVSQMVAIGAGLVLFVSFAPASVRVAFVNVAPNPPPDPMNGVLRI